MTVLCSGDLDWIKRVQADSRPFVHCHITLLSDGKMAPVPPARVCTMVHYTLELLARAKPRCLQLLLAWNFVTAKRKRNSSIFFFTLLTFLSCNIFNLQQLPCHKAWCVFRVCFSVLSQSLVLWSIDHHANLQTHAHCCSIHSSWETERTEMSFNWWMDNENVVPTHCGILFSSKKKKTEA